MDTDNLPVRLGVRTSGRLLKAGLCLRRLLRDGDGSGVEISCGGKHNIVTNYTMSMYTPLPIRYINGTFCGHLGTIIDGSQVIEQEG